MAVTKKAKSGTKAASKGASKGAMKSSGAAAKTKGGTTTKAAATKTTASSSASKSAAPKKAAAVKLNDRQREYLQKIKAAGETGYEAGPSYEQRTIDALVERKLVKRGAKDKESGKHRFMLTKTGEKHITPGAPPATPS